MVACHRAGLVRASSSSEYDVVFQYTARLHNVVILYIKPPWSAPNDTSSSPPRIPLLLLLPTPGRAGNSVRLTALTALAAAATTEEVDFSTHRLSVVATSSFSIVTPAEIWHPGMTTPSS